MGAAMREGSVKAGRFDIRYVESGAGQPVIYLSGEGGRTLPRAHEMLAERYRVIALEIPEPGQGQAAWTLGDAAPVMNSAIEALGLERFDMMGNSVGADLALRMAIERPQRVNSLVLIAPTAIRPKPARSTPDAAAKPSAEQERQRLSVFRRLIAQERDEALEERMREIAVPVLALFGTADAVVPTDAARLYSALLPKCFPVMVYDATHAVESDRPEAVAAIVGDFLAYGEGFVINRQKGLINP